MVISLLIIDELLLTKHSAVGQVRHGFVQIGLTLELCF